jgi:hypothetical protein
MQKEIKIITTVSAWPEAIEYQAKLIKKFCRDEYEFIAIIDTGLKPHYSNMWNKSTHQQAQEIAYKYCHSVVEMPQNLHQDRLHLFPNTLEIKGNKPSLRTADSCQYAWHYLNKLNAKKAILIDSDMFPVASFSFQDLVGEKYIGAVKQLRKNSEKQIEYLWNGIIAADFESLPNLHEISFDAGLQGGLPTDTGGASHSWVAENIDKIQWLEYKSSLNWASKDMPRFISGTLRDFIVNDDRNQNKMMYSEVYADTFFHFRGGGNWNMEPRKIVYSRREKIFQGFSEILCEDFTFQQPKRHFSLRAIAIEFLYYWKWKIKRFSK